LEVNDKGEILEWENSKNEEIENKIEE